MRPVWGPDNGLRILFARVNDPAVISRAQKKERTILLVRSFRFEMDHAAAGVGFSGVWVKLCCRNAAAPIIPPSPIDSTTLLGTTMRAPFSLSPS